MPHEDPYLSEHTGAIVDAAITAVKDRSTGVTANTIVQRDAAGRIKAEKPSALDDVATKGYVDPEEEAITYTEPSLVVDFNKKKVQRTTVAGLALSISTLSSSRMALGANRPKTVVVYVKNNSGGTVVISYPTAMLAFQSNPLNLGPGQTAMIGLISRGPNESDTTIRIIRSQTA